MQWTPFTTPPEEDQLILVRLRPDTTDVQVTVFHSRLVQYNPESSYLLDATNPNRLWFHQFRERNWLSLNGLLRQSIEQFAA